MEIVKRDAQYRRSPPGELDTAARACDDAEYGARRPHTPDNIREPQTLHHHWVRDRCVRGQCSDNCQFYRGLEGEKITRRHLRTTCTTVRANHSVDRVVLPPGSLLVRGLERRRPPKPYKRRVGHVVVLAFGSYRACSTFQEHGESLVHSRRWRDRGVWSAFSPPMTHDPPASDRPCRHC